MSGLNSYDRHSRKLADPDKSNRSKTRRQPLRKRLQLESLERRALLTGLVIELQADSDTGQSHSDGVTNLARPIFDILSEDSGTLTIDFDQDGLADITQRIDQAGTYSVTSIDLTEGPQLIQATLENESGSETASVEITVDSAPPQFSPGQPVYASGVSTHVIPLSEPLATGTAHETDFVVRSVSSGAEFPVTGLTQHSSDLTLHFAPLDEGEYQLVHNGRIQDIAGNSFDSQNAIIQEFSVVGNMLRVTDSLTIGEGDLSKDGTHLVADGATVTITGEHSFRSFRAINGSVIKHEPGSREGMSLTISESLHVDATSLISADGAGFAGGRDGSPNGQGPGAGSGARFRSGGGHGGEGGNGFAKGRAGVRYGDSLSPTSLGSGGGYDDYYNGGAAGSGGGAIRLVVGDSLVLEGSITANGGNGSRYGGGGSGGSIWVTAGQLSGDGTFQANGGKGGTDGGGGGGGRIAVYAHGLSNYSGIPDSSTKAGEGYTKGNKGSIAFIDQAVPGNRLILQDRLDFEPGSTIDRFNEIVVNNNGLLVLRGKSTVHAEMITVEAGGHIAADATGYLGGRDGSPDGQGPGGSLGNRTRGGAGHGGSGGDGYLRGNGGVTYGSSITPTEPGSGGGWDDYYNGHAGGNGGGAIRLVVRESLVLNGSITANGGHGNRYGGGGSGGSIWVTTDRLSGVGSFRANGGDGGSSSGGGGGGRIAIQALDVSSYTGGGTNSVTGGSGFSRGEEGTITYPETIDQFEFVVDEPTTIFVDIQKVYGSDVQFQLIEPDGTAAFIASGSTDDPDSADFGPLLLRNPGLYSLVGSAVTDATAPNYQFRIWDVPQVAVRTLELSSSTVAVFEVPGATHEWQFTVNQNRSVALDVSEITGTEQRFDFILRGPDRNVVQQTTGTSSLPSLADWEFTVLDQAGTYTLEVNPQGDDTGAYRFELVGAGAPRVVSSAIHGSSPGLADSAVFRFNQGMDTDSFSLDADFIEILSPDGQVTPQSHRWMDPKTLEIQFDPVNAKGAFTVTLGPTVQNPNGESIDQDQDGISLEPVEDRYVHASSHQPLTLNKRIIGKLVSDADVERRAFSAVAGQQVRFELLSDSQDGIRFDFTGPAGWIGFQDQASSSDLITLPRTGEYLITTRSNGSMQNPNYSFRVTSVDETVLQPGGTFTGDLHFSGQSQLFRIEVEEPSVLQIKLDDQSSRNHNELYIQRGTPPTRGQYQYRYENAASADQEIFIPRATSGTWYVLVYTDLARDTSSYTLSVGSTTMFLEQVSPNQLSTAQESTLTIQGAGFDSSIVVELVGENEDSFAVVHNIDSYERIRVPLMPHTIPPGSYSVRITREDGSVVESSREIRFAEGAKAELETNLVLPNALGFHKLGTIYIEYANVGNAPMTAPILHLNATQEGRAGAIMTLDQSRVSTGFRTRGLPEGFSNTIQVLASGSTAGVLQPGESVRVPVYWAGWQTPWNHRAGFQFSLTVTTADSSVPANLESFKEDARPDAFAPDAWEVVWGNFVGNVGSTWGDFVQMLGENASYLEKLGQRVIDVQDLVNFEVSQANGLLPTESLADSVDVSLSTPDLALRFSRHYRGVDIEGRFNKGPLGRGWTHNWQWSLEKLPDETIQVSDSDGIQYVFKPDLRSTLATVYLSQHDDGARLTELQAGSDTLMMLGEPNGLLRVFSLQSGQLQYVKSLNGTVIKAEYEANKLTRLTHGAERLLFDPTYSSNRTIHFGYNPHGLLDTVADSFGKTARYSYDPSGEHLTSVQGSDGLVTSYDYNSSPGPSIHSLSAITFPGNERYQFDYDEIGRLSGFQGAAGQEQTSFSYDSTGKITATNALDESIRMFVDHRDIVVRVEDDLGHSTQVDVSADFRTVQITDNEGRTYSYDSNREGQITVTDPLGQSVQFNILTNPGHFTPSGSLGSYSVLDGYSDSIQNETDYKYHVSGGGVEVFDTVREISYADGSSEQWTYQHDAAPLDGFGLVTEWTNRRGETIEYGYDEDGRIIFKRLPDGTLTTISYDGRGNVATVTDGRGVTRFSYDQGDFLRRVDYPSGRNLEYTYDTAGRRQSMTDHSGNRQNYSYDDLGRLSRMTNGQNQLIIEYVYDATGRLERENKGNGTYTTYKYDVAGQLIHLVNSAPDDSVQSRFDYVYDAAGRRIGMSTLDGSWRYDYDANGQLIRAVFDSRNNAIEDQDLSYTYDANGNRISTTINGETTVYVSNEMNQYESVGSARYRYDDDGNLISKEDNDQVWTYEYNVENRLTKVTTPEGTWEYEYDAWGNRVATIENGKRTEYLLDMFGFVNVVGEYTDSSTTVANYVHGSKLVSLHEGSGSELYYGFDGLGSARELTDHTGRVADSYSYAPFGDRTTESEQEPNPFQYVAAYGVMRENNELVFMRARYYNTDLGRFMTEDPTRLSSGDVNYVRYALNNPIEYTDPKGLKATVCIDPDRRGIVFIPCSPEPTSTPTPPPTPTPSAQPTPVECPPGWGVAPSGNCCLPALDPTCQPGGESTTRPQIQPTPWCIVDGCSEIVDLVNSVDPNELTGPKGFGEENFIQLFDTIPYQIDFENDKVATAPAQIVIISNPLSSDLDWTTFELTEIVFGDETIDVPPGLQHFETTHAITGHNGEPIEVQIEAGIRAHLGEVFAIFETIDPRTQLPPDATTGFLPPEDGTGRGMGHVSYLIKANDGLATGTEIRNIANIIFDFNETIATNQVDPHDPTKGTDPKREALVTIDARRPSSNVKTATQIQGTTDVLVEWGGVDDTNGSGIGSYSVFVSTDGGSFQLWQAQTTETSGTFEAQAGHTYEFFSIAADNVGNAESIQSTPEATVSVQSVIPPQFTSIPGTIVKETANPSGSLVEFDLPEAVDGSGQRLDVACTPDQASLFSVGITTVQCTATDALANSASLSFEVMVTLKEIPKNNVRVSENGKVVTLRGDGFDNHLVVEELNRNTIQVTGLNGTVVSGETGALRMRIGRQSLRILTGAGNDRIELGNMRRSVVLNSGSGNDSVEMGSVRNRSARLTLGSGDDSVTVVDAVVDGLLNVKTGSGNDNVLIRKGTVRGTTLISTDKGSDRVEFDDATFFKKATVKTGDDKDQVLVERSGSRKGRKTTFRGGVSISTGNGADAILLGLPNRPGNSVEAEGRVSFHGGLGADTLDAGLLAKPNPNGNHFSKRVIQRAIEALIS